VTDGLRFVLKQSTVFPGKDGGHTTVRTLNGDGLDVRLEEDGLVKFELQFLFPE
jgi:hypothetical protein